MAPLNLKPEFATRLQFVAICLLGLFLFVSWWPDFIQTQDHDSAFNYTYQYLFAHDPKFETGLYYTTGPWSFVFYGGFYPPTFWIALAAQAGLAVAMAALVGRVAIYHIESKLLRLGFVLGCFGFFTISRDSGLFFLLHAPLLALPSAKPLKDNMPTILLLGAIGFAMLVKGNVLLVGILIIGFLAIFEIGFCRRIPVWALAIIASFFGFSLLAGQNPNAILGNTVESVLVNTAYTELLAEQGDPVEFVIFLFLSAVFLLTLLFHEFKQRRAWGVFIALTYGAIWFLIYKQAFVRQDGQHMIRGYATLLSVGAAYFFCNRASLTVWFAERAPSLSKIVRFENTPKLALPVIAVAVALAGGIILVNHPTFYEGKLKRLAEQAAGISALAAGGLSHFESIHKERLAEIRKKHPMPPILGTVGGVSSILTPILAHGLPFRPIPTVAPHLATTPAMERKNIAFLRGADAPEFLLADNYLRHSTGRAVLEAYKPIALNHRHLIMRRATFTKIKMQPVSSVLARWGDEIPVPDPKDGVIVAKLIYKRTPLTGFLDFFYQGPVVRLESKERGQWGNSLPISRAQAAAGFTVSPNINSIVTMAALGTSAGRKYLQSRRADAIRLQIVEGWWWRMSNVLIFFKPEIIVSFTRFSPPDRKLSPAADQAQWRRLHALMQVKGNGEHGWPKIEILADRTPAIEVPSRESLVVPINLAASAVSFTYRHTGSSNSPIKVLVKYLIDGKPVSQRIIKLPGVADGTFDVNLNVHGTLLNALAISRFSDSKIKSTLFLTKFRLILPT